MAITAEQKERLQHLLDQFDIGDCAYEITFCDYEAVRAALDTLNDICAVVGADNIDELHLRLSELLKADNSDPFVSHPVPDNCDVRKILISVNDEVEGYCKNNDEMVGILTYMSERLELAESLVPRELSNEEEERAAFEKNAEKRGYPILRYVDDDDVEQYEDEDTHRIWLTWQARAVLAAKGGA